MKAILFLAGGVLAVFIFMFGVKKFLATPEHIFFFSLSSEKNLTETKDVLIERLKKEGMKVRILSEGEGYVRMRSCNPEEVKEVLTKAPFFSLLIPCDVIIESDQGETKVASVKEAFLIGYYSDTLKDREIRAIINQFHRLRVIMAEVVK